MWTTIYINSLVRLEQYMGEWVVSMTTTILINLRKEMSLLRNLALVMTFPRKYMI
ncbi:hypothetical protein QWZ13_11630 [Reinekea marina]|nr:hypothetical protein [Reinekea marina]MDN3649566.1 hypothetical protein [Reinekea marina]